MLRAFFALITAGTAVLASAPNAQSAMGRSYLVSHDAAMTATTGESPSVAPRGTFACYGIFEGLNVHCASRSGAAYQQSVDFIGVERPIMNRPGTMLAFRTFPASITGVDQANYIVSLRTPFAGRTKVQIGPGGTPPAGDVDIKAISASGRFILVESNAGNLGFDDRNPGVDCFRYDRQLRTLTPAGPHSGRTILPVGSTCAGLSDNGRFAAVESGNQVWRRDFATGAFTLITRNRNGQKAALGGNLAGISANGGLVGFTSPSSDLINGDTNGVADVFIRNVSLGKTTRVSVRASGQQLPNGAMASAVGNWMSADGRMIAFVSRDLPDGSTAVDPQIIARDRTANRTFLVSSSPSGSPGNEPSWIQFSFSAEGRYLAFMSMASNLAAGVSDTNVENDVYVRDLGNFRPVALSRITGVRLVNNTLTFVGGASRDRDGRITTYRWTFGDGTSARGSRVTHRYVRRGAFTVRLTVRDNEGATASITRRITIR